MSGKLPWITPRSRGGRAGDIPEKYKTKSNKQVKKSISERSEAWDHNSANPHLDYDRATTVANNMVSTLSSMEFGAGQAQAWYTNGMQSDAPPTNVPHGVWRVAMRGLSITLKAGKAG